MTTPALDSTQPIDRVVEAVDPRVAEDFLRMFHDAHSAAGPLSARLAEVRAELAATGTYRHTAEELSYGARIALRDSGWSTSGVPWRQLKVRDLRGLRKAAAVATECVSHLRQAGTDGPTRPLITVFAADAPGAPGPAIWNDQLIRYAGYRISGGWLGDRRYLGLTDTVRRMGWKQPSPRGRFDRLPLVVETAQEGPKLFALPGDACREIALEHPDLPWFAGLGLRWPAVPVIGNMRLTIGGVSYPAAPFHSWHVGTEIGTRGLADESAYGVAAEVAERLGLDTSSERTLWRDRATLELNRAVLYSFDAAGVTVTDHHTEAAHRLAWLRSRQRFAAHRPAFRIDPSRAARARDGLPAAKISAKGSPERG